MNYGKLARSAFEGHMNNPLFDALSTESGKTYKVVMMNGDVIEGSDRKSGHQTAREMIASEDYAAEIKIMKAEISRLNRQIDEMHRTTKWATRVARAGMVTVEPQQPGTQGHGNPAPG